MGFLSSAWKAVTVGQEVQAAVTAAVATWDAGHGPIAAARTFAASTGGQFDDVALAEIEAGLRQGLVALRTVVGVAAWIAAHEAPVRHGVDAALEAALDVGYAASGWNARLTVWLDES